MMQVEAGRYLADICESKANLVYIHGKFQAIGATQCPKAKDVWFAMMTIYM